MGKQLHISLSSSTTKFLTSYAWNLSGFFFTMKFLIQLKWWRTSCIQYNLLDFIQNNLKFSKYWAVTEGISTFITSIGSSFHMNSLTLMMLITTIDNIYRKHAMWLLFFQVLTTQSSQWYSRLILNWPQWSLPPGIHTLL